MHFIKPALAAALIALTVSANPVRWSNETSPTIWARRANETSPIIETRARNETRSLLAPRQIFQAECMEFHGQKINRENFALLTRTWLSAHNTDGGGRLNEGEHGANTYQGVCCNNQCLSLINTALRDITWSAEDFHNAIKDFEGAWDDAAEICRGPVGGDHNLAMSYGDWGNALGGEDYITIMGDTCNGAPGYHGEP